MSQTKPSGKQKGVTHMTYSVCAIAVIITWLDNFLKEILRLYGHMEWVPNEKLP